MMVHTIVRGCLKQYAACFPTLVLRPGRMLAVHLCVHLSNKHLIYWGGIIEHRGQCTHAVKTAHSKADSSAYMRDTFSSKDEGSFQGNETLKMPQLISLMWSSTWC